MRDRKAQADVTPGRAEKAACRMNWPERERESLQYVPARPAGVAEELRQI